MESTLQAPYAFFEYFFNVTLYEECERSKEDEELNEYKYKDFYTTLTDYIGVPHTQELIKSKNFVEQNISNKLADSNELGQYLIFLKTKLSIFSETRAYQDFEFVRRYTKDLQEHLGKYGSTIPKATIATNSELSFLLLGTNDDNVNSKVEKLFSQFVEHPPLIDCSKEEFTNAFTGIPITTSTLQQI
ncbi:MAG: hypothetical protein GYB37_15060 [Algicola sp.]|nr:hypothetical protein [Algicola sp.]